MTVKESTDMNTDLVSIGPCPVCGTFAPVLLLVRIADGLPVYYCPGCETAWLEAPVFPILDSVSSVAALAPLGVRLPTHHEVSASVPVANTVAYADWKDELDGILRRPS